MLYLQLIGGFILLVVGGDALVRGAVSLARRLGVSPLLIGLTLVGFGTSTPELLTSVQAALLGSPGIAVGNVVGSNICNILLILGVGALIYPLRTTPETVWRDGTMVLAVTLACVAVALYGWAGRGVGIALLLVLAAYLTGTYLRERRTPDASASLHAAEADLAEPAPTRLAVSLAFAGGGLVLTLLGARLLVEGAIDLARIAGISETVLGLTLVALGTSLPELVTAVIAALRRHTDVALGNVLGSNIFNVLGILGTTAVIHPIPVPPEIARVDVWVMLAATLLMLLFTVTGWRLSRTEGGVFLAGYVGYMGYLATVA